MQVCIINKVTVIREKNFISINNKNVLLVPPIYAQNIPDIGLAVFKAPHLFHH